MEYGDTNFQEIILKDAIDAKEEFTFEKMHSSIAMGLFEPMTDKIVDSKKYVNWEA